MEDLASRLASRVQLTTDGHKAYLSAVEDAFGWNRIDYAMLADSHRDSRDHGRAGYRPRLHMYYNFVRSHMTLSKARGGMHTTPAMAAGVADHPWKLEEVVALLAA